MHLGQLELGLGANSWWQGRVANNVSKCLPDKELLAMLRSKTWFASRAIAERPIALQLSLVRTGKVVPLDFVLLKDLPLGVIADRPGLDEAAQIELLRPEHRHGGWFG